jgi:exonuclease VII large subunit
LQERLADIQMLAHRLQQASPTNQLNLAESHLGNLQGRANRAIEHHMEMAKARLAAGESLLVALDPFAIMRRGYTQLTTSDRQALVTRATQLTEGDQVTAHFVDGYANLVTAGIMNTSMEHPDPETPTGKTSG